MDQVVIFIGEGAGEHWSLNGKGRNMSAEFEKKALQQVAVNSTFNFIGNAKYKIGEKVVHVRYCGTDDRGSSKYKFNINPNTLSADYELWVCGKTDFYYLIPVSVMKDIYSHPEAYVDRRYPEIRVVSLDIASHKLTYARGGTWLNISPYWRVTLK